MADCCHTFLLSLPLIVDILLAVTGCPRCQPTAVSFDQPLIIKSTGLLKPLPAVVSPIEQAPNALCQLSAAKNIFKRVVQVPSQLPMPDLAINWQLKLTSQGFFVNFAGDVELLPAAVFY